MDIDFVKEITKMGVMLCFRPPRNTAYSYFRVLDPETGIWIDITLGDLELEHDKEYFKKAILEAASDLIDMR